MKFWPAPCQILWSIKEADFDAEAACSLSVEYNSLAWKKEKTSQTLTLTVRF